MEGYQVERIGDQSRQSPHPTHVLTTQSNVSENMWELRKQRKQDLVGLSGRGWGAVSELPPLGHLEDTRAALASENWKSQANRE